MFTPTFFINSRRYDGPWDESSFSDAMLGTLGHRVRSAALDFASWGPSAGILLLLATLVAVIVTNTGMGPGFDRFWEQSAGLSLGSLDYTMSLRHWVNDGLLTIFFLVVGLEIKREFTVGHLASRRSAALPIAAAIGGMVVPALIYAFVIPPGRLVARLGRPDGDRHGLRGRPDRHDGKPRARRAAHLPHRRGNRRRHRRHSGGGGCSIPHDLQFEYLVAAAAIVAALAALNRSHVYLVQPYVLLGIALWACVLASGLHATLAGVILALFIPTRPPPNFRGLMSQVTTILEMEARHGDEVLRHGPSQPTLDALDAIHDRIELPADRLLRHAGARSSYIVLPLFALANAGVVIATDVFTGRELLMAAIAAGLVIGKPLGLVAASVLAVKLGAAVKPAEYSWRQLCGAGALAGIGFTMSLFIAGQALPNAPDFAAAKIAVFVASILSALIGVAILWNARSGAAAETASEA